MTTGNIASEVKRLPEGIGKQLLIVGAVGELQPEELRAIAITLDGLLRRAATQGHSTAPRPN